MTPKLTAGDYVFPVYGPSGYGDTFGAPRGDVSGGWHHGDDIFAPLGAPILAVADGTVFSVGWNEIGGWRLWLRDSGRERVLLRAPLRLHERSRVNGRHVKAGQVLGFVGNTGDAQGTPFHLHFEVHPVSLLFLGYDGAVDPTQYLDAWKRLEDVRILPAVPFAALAASVQAASSAPAPGAILLQSERHLDRERPRPRLAGRAMRAPVAVDVTGAERRRAADAAPAARPGLEQVESPQPLRLDRRAVAGRARVEAELVVRRRACPSATAGLRSGDRVVEEARRPRRRAAATSGRRGCSGSGPGAGSPPGGARRRRCAGCPGYPGRPATRVAAAVTPRGPSELLVDLAGSARTPA